MAKQAERLPSFRSATDWLPAFSVSTSAAIKCWLQKRLHFAGSQNLAIFFLLKSRRLLAVRIRKNPTPKTDRDKKKDDWSICPMLSAILAVTRRIFSRCIWIQLKSICFFFLLLHKNRLRMSTAAWQDDFFFLPSSSSFWSLCNNKMINACKFAELMVCAVTSRQACVTVLTDRFSFVLCLAVLFGLLGGSATSKGFCSGRGGVWKKLSE